MTNCTNTGIAVPECSCRACLQAQIERHMPSLLAGSQTEPRPLGHRAAELTPRSEPERRAA